MRRQLNKLGIKKMITVTAIKNTFMGTTIFTNDTIAIELIKETGIIDKIIPINDEAEMILCTFGEDTEDSMKITNLPIIRYCDGTLFMPIDWQGYLPGSIDEIEDIDWVECTTGRDAIILNGLPRLFM